MGGCFMLSALLQTIANLGFDASAVSNAFNAIMATVQAGDTSSLEGLGGIFTGILSIITGLSSADISTVINALVSSIIELLSSDSATSVLSTITGA